MAILAKRRLIIYSLFILFALLTCSLFLGFGVEANSVKKNTAGTNDVRFDRKLVSSNTNFGFILFSELTKKDAGQNIFLSPTSIGVCLSMAYNGAATETSTAMANALRLQGMSVNELNDAYAQWRAALQKPHSMIDLEIANSIWARNGAQFRPEFIDANKRFYGAEVTTLNFSDPNSASVINSWVNTKTRGKIERIVDNISGDSMLFLVNAVYFKGKWTSAFDRANTADGYFTAASGVRQQRPMMRQRGDYQYLENENFQAISLPYGEGDWSMYVFLPSQTSSLSSFEKNLTPANWDAWIDDFELGSGEIVMPRFKVEYEVTLNNALKAMGMGVAFDPQRADFSGMLQTSLRPFISEVKHKAFAEVNEEGTEATAATSTEVRVISAMIPSKKFRMVVDRPFFFAIRDNTSGALLFLGSVTNV
jgi:serpin B